MKISTKILNYFNEKGISQKEIAESYGVTRNNLWNILNKESGKVPLDFIIWIAAKHPDLDLNTLFREETNEFGVNESSVDYHISRNKKKEILEEISKTLDKHL